MTSENLTCTTSSQNSECVGEVRICNFADYAMKLLTSLVKGIGFGSVLRERNVYPVTRLSRLELAQDPVSAQYIMMNERRKKGFDGTSQHARLSGDGRIKYCIRIPFSRYC